MTNNFIRFVDSKGVMVERCCYIHEDLARFVGQKVLVSLDPAYPVVVFVFSLKGDFICIAEKVNALGNEMAQKMMQEIAQKIRQRFDDLKRGQL